MVGNLMVREETGKTSCWVYAWGSFLISFVGATLQSWRWEEDIFFEKLFLHKPRCINLLEIVWPVSTCSDLILCQPGNNCPFISMFTRNQSVSLLDDESGGRVPRDGTLVTELCSSYRRLWAAHVTQPIFPTDQKTYYQSWTINREKRKILHVMNFAVRSFHVSNDWPVSCILHPSC